MHEEIKFYFFVPVTKILNFQVENKYKIRKKTFGQKSEFSCNKKNNKKTPKKHVLNYLNEKIYPIDLAI